MGVNSKLILNKYKVIELLLQNNHGIKTKIIHIILQLSQQQLIISFLCVCYIHLLQDIKFHKLILREV